LNETTSEIKLVEQGCSDMTQCPLRPYLKEVAVRVDRHEQDLRGLGESTRSAHHRIGILEASIDSYATLQTEQAGEFKHAMEELKREITTIAARWDARHDEEHQKLDRILAAVSVSTVENVKRWENVYTTMLKGLGVVTVLGSGVGGIVWAIRQAIPTLQIP
jgi:hypothetical protein